MIDRPDLLRKRHKINTPLLGGLMIFLCFSLNTIYSLYLEEFNVTLISIFMLSSFCFILGLFDDLKNLAYKYKFLFLTLFFYLTVNLDSNLAINEIYSSTLDRRINLDNIGIFFTILCLLLLTNSINLIDGIDGLCLIISIILLIWLIFVSQSYNFYYSLIFFSLCYTLYLNLKKNIFLGDSGSLFLGTLIGLLIIYNYNDKLLENNFAVENIFIALMLPGIDMLRVFSERIFKKKNPFLADRNHLHHLLLDKPTKLFNTLLVIALLILIPILVNIFTEINQIKIIFSYFLSYLILVYYLKKN